MDPAWSPPVMTCSGATATGLKELWETIGLHRKKTTDSGSRDARRSDQQITWMNELIQDGLMAAFRAHPAVKEKLVTLRAAVAAGELPASAAADQLFSAFGIGPDA